MPKREILISTAELYRSFAKNDSSYNRPSKILHNAVRQLGFTKKTSLVSIKDSEQFIVVREPGTSEGMNAIRHPLNHVERGIDAGIEALKSYKLLDNTRIGLIAVSRGSLTCTFTLIYEVLRRCNWSILPLGGSDDGRDISQLCNLYNVDTLFIASGALDAVFNSGLIGHFGGIRNVLYVSGIPSQKTLNVIKTKFSHIDIYPFLYIHDITGPIGLPTGIDNKFIALDHILIEVKAKDGSVKLNGFGRLLVSVLGLEKPILIRTDIGDYGVLTTNDDGRQVVQLCRGKEVAGGA